MADHEIRLELAYTVGGEPTRETLAQLASTLLAQLAEPSGEVAALWGPVAESYDDYTGPFIVAASGHARTTAGDDVPSGVWEWTAANYSDREPL